MNRTLTLAGIALLLAAPCGAAPIYGDVSVDGGIHFVSDETFRIAGFWTPEEGVAGTIDNPFEIPDPHFDGHVWRVDSIFPAQCGGTWQVDAWYYGGWWGEVRAGADCDPSPPPEITPFCVTDCAPPCLENCTPPPVCPDCTPTPRCESCATVSEPPTVLLCGVGAGLTVFRYGRSRCGRRRYRAAW